MENNNTATPKYWRVDANGLEVALGDEDHCRKVAAKWAQEVDEWGDPIKVEVLEVRKANQ